MTRTYRRVELLPNGFVRIEHSAGIVRLYERTDGGVALRSGNGRVQGDDVIAAAELLDVPAVYVEVVWCQQNVSFERSTGLGP